MNTAARESAVANAGNAVGDGDAREAAAVIESAVTNAGDAVGDCDAL